MIFLGINDKYEQLKALDFIANQKIGNENLLPVRGHFYKRGIGGVYVCANPNCAKHEHHKPTKALGDDDYNCRKKLRMWFSND